MGRKSLHETTFPRVKQYMSERDRALKAKEIAEFLEVTNSTAYGILHLMEVFGIVQKVKRGRSYYYFLKDVYDDEQISAMLPPERVARIPKCRKYVPRSTGHSKLPVRESFLEEHLSTMRVRASSGEGPSALAIIGLSQLDAEEPLAEIQEAQRVLDVLPEAVVWRRGEPAMIGFESYGTVESIPRDFRLLTLGQTKYLKDKHLKGLDGYGEIDRFGNFFADRSYLENRRYGNVFYVSMSTNSWERAYRVTVDDSLSLEMEVPVKKLRGGYGSKYDPIIDRFIECEQDLVEIGVEGRKPSYVTSQLRRRIEDRGLEIVASSAGGFVYLERKPSE